MKFILSVIFSFSILFANSQNTYYMSPSGNDANSGSFASPVFTLVRAWQLLSAGDTLYLRGGTYNFIHQQYLQLRNGTASDRIKVWAYPGEQPILKRNYPIVNGVDQDLVYLEGNYFHFKGIEIGPNPQLTGETPWSSFRCGFTNGSTFENIKYHGNAAGFQIRGASSDNLVLNCDFYENEDPLGSDGLGTYAYDGADGLDINFVSGTNNTVKNCRAWWNADDGFDVWQNNGKITFDSCWAFFNGYIKNTFNIAGNGTGFKLGEMLSAQYSDTLRTVTNCVAYKNRSFGFAENDLRAKSIMYNNTSARSGTYGYWFGVWQAAAVATLKNNLSFSESNQFGAQVIFQTNSWNVGSVNNTDFVSLDSTQLYASRQSNYNLPNLTFLNLTEISALRDAGTNVGLPFNGSNPDIGAFEYGGVTNLPPTANAGSDQFLPLVSTSTTLTGSGNDPDGTIASYAWTQISGTAAGITSPSDASTGITGLTAGVRVFRLTVTDNGGATAFDDIQVTIANIPPTVSAGGNKSIIAPASSVTAIGSASDPDGSITAYNWTFTSKPVGAPDPVIETPAISQSPISNLVVGNYTIRLTVTDNSGGQAFSEMIITVNSAAFPSYVKLKGKKRKLYTPPPSGPTNVTYPSLDNWQQAPTGSWGYVTVGDGGGRANISLPASGNGRYQADYDGTINTMFAAVVLDPNPSNNSAMPYYDFGYALFVDGSEKYICRYNGTNVFTSTITAVTNSFALFREGGNTIAARYFDGTDWILIHTFSVTTTAQLYLNGATAAPGWPVFVKNPKQIGAN